jgi:Domain of unknown function (DUF4167)
MRQGPNSKRLRGRGGGRKSAPSRHHSFESNGPDVKVRGSAQQVVEKYMVLARDASLAGDRVAAESYFQHAEHYYRVMTANGAYQNNSNSNSGGGTSHSNQNTNNEAAPEAADAQPAEAATKPEAEPQEMPAAKDGGDAEIVSA